jgi:6-phosphogluconate dehydrogenase
MQGMNVIKAKSDAAGWEVDLANLARIWKGGCIIRAGFLDRIKNAYLNNPKLDSLLLDEGFAKDLVCAYHILAGTCHLRPCKMILQPGTLQAALLLFQFTRLDLRS